MKFNAEQMFKQKQQINYIQTGCDFVVLNFSNFTIFTSTLAFYMEIQF